MHQDSDLCGHYLSIFAIFRALLDKLNHTCGCGEQGVILTYTHVVSSVEFGAALTHNNTTRIDFLTAKYFDAESFAL